MSTTQTIRAGWGLLQLAAPGLVADRVLPAPLDHRATVVARLLAARQVLQAGLLRNPGPMALALGAVVDGLHAASMIGLAAFNARRRRAALLDASIAATFAVSGALGARRAGRR